MQNAINTLLFHQEYKDLITKLWPCSFEWNPLEKIHDFMEQKLKTWKDEGQLVSDYQTIQISIYLSMLPYKPVTIYKLPEHEGEEGP